MQGPWAHGLIWKILHHLQDLLTFLSQSLPWTSQSLGQPMFPFLKNFYFIVKLSEQTSAPLGGCHYSSYIHCLVSPVKTWPLSAGNSLRIHSGQMVCITGLLEGKPPTLTPKGHPLVFEELKKEVFWSTFVEVRNAAKHRWTPPLCLHVYFFYH